MNTRSVRKRLMKHRHESRAYLVVRVPLSIIEAPPEHLTFPGFREIAEGIWRNGETDEQIHIQRNRSLGIPPWEAGNCMFFVHEDPESPGWFEYWEGYRYVIEDGEVERSILPEGTVRKVRDFTMWHDRLSDGAHPVLTALARVPGRKGMNIQVSENMKYAYFQFSVKWWQHWSKKMFCAGVSRALRMAKRMNIQTKIMKGCFE